MPASRRLATPSPLFLLLAAAALPACGEAGPTATTPAGSALKNAERTPKARPRDGDPALVVRRALAETLGRKLEAIDPSKTFAQLGADELDLVETVMEVEETLDVTIADEALEKAAGPGKADDLARRLTVGQLIEAARKAVKDAGRP